MTETTYHYDIGEFPYGQIAFDQLRHTIDLHPDIPIKLSGKLAPTFDGASMGGCNITFLDALPSRAPLDAIVAAHTGTGLPDAPMTADGTPITASVIDEDGDTPTLITSNWCDPTTWYSSSERVTAKTLTDSGDHTTYNSGDAFWIDLRQGALTQGHLIWPAYAFEVRVNGDVQTPNNRNGNGGVYTLDAATGAITFDSILDPADVVDADYSKMKDSVWTLRPNVGKKLKMRTVEVQFTTDIDLTTASIFEVFGWVEVFAPDLAISNGGPLPDGTLVPLKTVKYETMHNYIDEAQEAYATIPAMGGSSWRGMQYGVHVFRWPYTQDAGKPLVLEASKGMELRIYLEDDTPFSGGRAVASVYTRSVDE
ncbi:MAG: hypothetical protein CL819_01280 [Croceicoccus sp.]|nr:hypothetical protein [Croceicoccus sp.]